MGSASRDRAEAARLPEGDVVRILLEQHARIREMFDAVTAAEDEAKQSRFDELRAFLAVHETAEEMVLRPISMGAAGKDVADARNHEEAEANEVLAQLERLDVTSADFDRLLADFRSMVLDHAEAEEGEEFPPVLTECSEEQRRIMGLQLRAAEKVAPTHPHPSIAGSPVAQYAVGPVASIVDRTRDAISKVTG